MGKGKDEKPRRRRARTVTGLTNMQYASAATAVFGPSLLERLPHGFDSIEAGQTKAGKALPWWKNKRVLVVLALLLYCAMSDKLSTRLWSIPLAALLSLAIQQHRQTYGDETEASSLIETFAEEK